MTNLHPPIRNSQSEIRKSIAGSRDWLFQQDNLERGPVST